MEDDKDDTVQLNISRQDRETVDSASKIEEVLTRRQTCDQLSDSSNTKVNIDGIGLAEVESYDDERYLPAMELSINGHKHPVFLETDAQLREEALESLSNIPDVRSNDNVYVRDDTVYTRNISIEDNDASSEGGLVFLASYVVGLILSSVICLLSGATMTSMMILGVVALMLLLFLLESLSFRDTICAFDTQDEVDYKINDFDTYNPNNPFNKQYRVVELSLRDDNGLKLESDDGINWVIEGDGRMPIKDLSKYQIGEDGNNIRYAEKALVKENYGLTDGLISECGDYVIPTK